MDDIQVSEFNFDKHARYTGRMDWTHSDGPVLSWAGSSISVRFYGKTIAISLGTVERAGNWVDVTLDGGNAQKFHVENSRLIELEANSEGIHTLEIYNRVEAMFGTFQFLGCSVSGGGYFLAPPTEPTRYIEIIGDSISCGSGNEGENGQPNIAEHENNHLAYGSLAAQALGAEHHTIAVSGIGLLVNYGDERVNTMTDQYDRLNALHREPKWDFAKWVPHVVVINLGTNDNNYVFSSDEFVARYVAFVGRIRRNYQEAEIIMSLGPFQNEPVKDYIYEAYQQIRDNGDGQVHYLLFDKADVERDGLGETGHPNTITHRQMANQLIAEIRKVTRWT